MENVLIMVCLMCVVSGNTGNIFYIHAALSSTISISGNFRNLAKKRGLS